MARAQDAQGINRAAAITGDAAVPNGADALGGGGTFLRLAIPGSQRGPGGGWAARLAGPDAVDAVLRHESLIPQLRELVRGPLRHAFADLDAALSWLETPPRINESRRRDRAGMPHVPAALRAQLVERERVLYDAFYAGQRPDRLPTP